jgi:hypothetical protein
MTLLKERGRTCQFEKPVWEPLLAFAPEHIDDFMWMFEVELESGTRLHAYKHYWTRRYLHLSEDGRAFVYCWPDDPYTEDQPSWYREVDPEWLLSLVLADVEKLKH